MAVRMIVTPISQRSGIRKELKTQMPVLHKWKKVK